MFNYSLKTIDSLFFIKKEVKNMSLVADWRICPKCKRKYSFNPDVGNFTCPYCSGKKKPPSLINIIKELLKKD